MAMITVDCVAESTGYSAERLGVMVMRLLDLICCRLYIIANGATEDWIGAKGTICIACVQRDTPTDD